jgi:hypothetical protein
MHSTDSGGVRLQSEDPGFQVSHFFVLLSLLAATVAVVMARPSAPENLILISLTIGAAGIAALGLYRTLAPLVAPHSDLERQPLSERMRLDLEREKALTLRTIKELEFDRAMGKVSPQDFDDMAGRLRARALGIMKQLDAGSNAYRALIEKELAQRMAAKPTASSVAAGPAAVPDLPRSREASVASDGPGEGGRAAPAGICVCGTRNDPDARFCKSCGAKLVAA